MTPAVAQILGVETPRVWSFIVTIFGDLARHDDRYISSRTLNRLTAEIGVKPEATRVALYRLRKEDWLESTKLGRESHYRLTKNGRKLSREAAPRIYGPASDHSGMLSIYDPALSPPDGLSILSGISLVKTGFADALNIEIDKPLPKWIVDRLIDVELQRAILDLQRRLSVLAISSNASDLDRTVVRLSIVHEWRRIILRLPVAPYQVLEEAISLHDLRQTVQKLLLSLSDVSLDQIIDV